MGTKIDVVVAYGPIVEIIEDESLDSEKKLELVLAISKRALKQAEKD